MIFFSSDFHFDHSNVIRFDHRPDRDVEEMNERIISTTNEYVKEKDWFVYHGDLMLNNDIDHDDNDTYIKRIKYFLERLACKNIIFCCGNHDRTWQKRQGIHRPNWDLWNLFRIWECRSCKTCFDEQGRFSLPKKCACDGLQKEPIYNIHPMGYELRLTRRICAEQDIPRDYENLIVVCTHYSLRCWNKSHHKDRSINLYAHSHHGLPGLYNSFDVGFAGYNHVTGNRGWNRPLSLLEILREKMPEHNATNPTQIPHHLGE